MIPCGTTCVCLSPASPAVLVPNCGASSLGRQQLNSFQEPLGSGCRAELVSLGSCAGSPGDLTVRHCLCICRSQFLGVSHRQIESTRKLEILCVLNGIYWKTPSELLDVKD